MEFRRAVFRSPTAVVAITAIATDSAPVGTNNDFITNDTTLTVSGTHGTLGTGEKVQVSSDGGTNWADVTPSDATTWCFSNAAAPTETFTLPPRIVLPAGDNAPTGAGPAVTLDTTTPTAVVAITAI